MDIAIYSSLHRYDRLMETVAMAMAIGCAVTITTQGARPTVDLITPESSRRLEVNSLGEMTTDAFIGRLRQAVLELARASTRPAREPHV